MKNLKEKIGYGFGDMSSSMFWKIFTYYLPFFYSNIVGLSLDHAAVLILITKLWDAISDPMMGMISDRTETKWGKYRPYLLWMAIPFAIIGILMFFVPPFGQTGKLVYAYITYILMMTVYTAINVPYGAMLGVITNSPEERTIYSSFRMFFAYGGSFLALAIFEPLRNAFGGVGVPMAWTKTMIVIATICAILFFATFSLTREHVKPIIKKGKGSVGKDLKALLSNGPWWILLVAAISALLFNSIRGGAAAYYFQNFVGGHNSLGGKLLLTSGIFLAIGEISNMIGVVLAVPISRKIGKKMTYILAMVGTVVLSIAFYYVPLSVAGMWMMLILQIIISAFAGLTFPLLWSLYADVADYSEQRHKRSSTGLIFSSSSMAQKFGAAFGSALILWLLAAFHYNNTSADAPQTTQAITGLKMLMSWLPAAGSALAAVVMIFYPLTEKKMSEIIPKLEAQRKAENAINDYEINY